MRKYISILIGLALFIGIIGWTLRSSGYENNIGGYMTSLNQRTDSQIHNVRLAVDKINNTILLPGQTFSFLKCVGSWSKDRGFVKAPVSYDGELVRDWGGGVCQASTTLYNAALEAGLEIVERNSHHWPAKYAPLGRDAAVAFEDIDLKIKNNLPKPVRLTAQIKGDSLVFNIKSTYKPQYKVKIQSIVKSVVKPVEIIQDRAIQTTNARRRLINRGQCGFDVITYRWFEYPKKTKRETISEDKYPVMNRIVRIAER